ncbi:MAG: carbohydrate kinase family protein [Eubacteriales bacterium]|nr:carbohydrate kinase family protein [Eubacteriales bacterium]
MGKYDVFGLDHPCIDLNVNFDEMPEKNKGARVNEMSWQGGGKVSSGIVAAARLGASCAIAGALGDDIYGKFCYQDFVRHGINVDNMLLREGKTTHFSVVLSEKEAGTRTILFRMGDAGALTEEELDFELLKKARYLFIADCSPLTCKAVAAARENGVRVFIDADYYTDALVEMIPQIDVFVGSEFVFDGLFAGSKEKGLENLEEECRKIMEKGPEVVVFTFGEKGCVGCDGGGYFTLPAFRVDAVDTVGAGDVFHGAFLAALLKGKTAKECARSASAVSAIKCTKIGGRAGIPDEQVLEEFLHSGIIDYSEIDQRVAYYRRGLEYV